MPALRLEDGFPAPGLLALFHYTERPIVRPFRRGKTGCLSLPEIFSLIARFKPAHNGKDLVDPHSSRKPAEKPDAKTWPVAWGCSAIFLEQSPPSIGMTFFRCS